MKIEPPVTEQERELERLQGQVTRGELARLARDELIYELWKTGLRQIVITDRLNRGARRAGGEPITPNAVQKLIDRHHRSNGNGHPDTGAEQA